MSNAYIVLTTIPEETLSAPMTSCASSTTASAVMKAATDLSRSCLAFLLRGFSEITTPMPFRMLTVALSLGLLAGASAFAQSSAWIIDKNQTQIDFQIRRVPVSTVRGSFAGITGTVIWDEKQPSKSSVEVVIPTVSVSTNNSMRDADLKSDNFFNVEKYPTMTFKSTAVTGTPGHLKIVGNLTLAGVTKNVTLDVEGPTPPAKMGKLILGFAATGTIKRSDFNFAPKYPTVILGDEIRFTIDVEADQPLPQSH